MGVTGPPQHGDDANKYYNLGSYYCFADEARPPPHGENIHKYYTVG